MCDCNGKQDFQRCNCIKLYKVSYIYKEVPYITGLKYKDIANFKRYCELNNLPHKEYSDVKLVVNE